MKVLFVKTDPFREKASFSHLRVTGYIVKRPLFVNNMATNNKNLLGDFNFKDIDWPDRLSKSGSTLSQSEGQILIDIMNDHGLEQMVHFPTREKNTLDLILTTLPGQFKDIHSPDKLSDHDIVSETLKISTTPPPPPRPIKKPRRKVYLYQKGDYECMRKDTLEFAKQNTSVVTRILVQYRRTLIC